MEDDHGPHLRVQPEEAAFELVSVGDRRLEALGRRDLDRGELHVHAMAPEPSRLIDAGADDQPVEPCVEAIGIPERGQVTPGPDERVLHGVLGLFRVPEDEPGGAVQPGDRGACQRGEGVMIALPRSLHEVSLHDAPRRWRGHSAALMEYGEARPPNCSRSWLAGAATAGAATIECPPRPVRRRSRRRVKIHEADAKSLLVAQGLPVPAWEVARTPTQARAAAVRFLARPGNATRKVVIKAQVLVGGRGKAGGVRARGTADEAEDVAAQILALEIKGLPVRRVLVGPAAEIVKEYYLSVVLDRATKRLMFIGSAEGGVEIEQVAVDNPDAIVYEHADPCSGCPTTRPASSPSRSASGRTGRPAPRSPRACCGRCSPTTRTSWRSTRWR